MLKWAIGSKGVPLVLRCLTFGRPGYPFDMLFPYKGGSMRPRGQTVEAMAGLALAVLLAIAGWRIADADMGSLGLLLISGALVVLFWTLCLKWGR
jgi:hypothetical protein